ncbi:hypothetical protein LR48_Vigan10g216100 [Vigna angularis]|uniref:Uncharacterized protein n=1 Tax=Phaseolus angularis TaxID=3914 RepID=A0A0L9VND9_PHAAN|nr:hypothetical protein LR48_Vigan10g216100 [Vigna angularis]
MDAWQDLVYDDDVLESFLKKCDASSSLIPGPAEVLPFVACILKECKPNGLGDMQLTVKVQPFTTFRQNYYLNITHRSIVMVFPADVCHPTIDLVKETPKPIIRLPMWTEKKLNVDDILRKFVPPSDQLITQNDEDEVLMMSKSSQEQSRLMKNDLCRLETKVTAISESQNLNTMTMAALFGKLREHELDLGRLDEEEAKAKNNKKSLALKSEIERSKCKSEDEDSDEEENLSLMIKRLNRFMKSKAKETLSVELVKYCYGDRGIAGSSLVHLRKCLEEEFILREVFGGRVSSFVKIQRRCCFISCGFKRGVF